MHPCAVQKLLWSKPAINHQPQLSNICDNIQLSPPIKPQSKFYFDSIFISVKMDIDDNEDDFYGTEETAAPATSEAPQDAAAAGTESAPAEAKQEADEDLEEGEEEDEGGAMDEDDSSDDVSQDPSVWHHSLANWFSEHGDNHREKGRYISCTTIVSFVDMYTRPPEIVVAF